MATTSVDLHDDSLQVIVDLGDHGFEVSELQADALNFDSGLIHAESCSAEPLPRFTLDKILIPMGDTVSKVPNVLPSGGRQRRAACALQTGICLDGLDEPEKPRKRVDDIFKPINCAK